MRIDRREGRTIAVDLAGEVLFAIDGEVADTVMEQIQALRSEAFRDGMQDARDADRPCRPAVALADAIDDVVRARLRYRGDDTPGVEEAKRALEGVLARLLP